MNYGEAITAGMQHDMWWDTHVHNIQKVVTFADKKRIYIRDRELAEATRRILDRCRCPTCGR